MSFDKSTPSKRSSSQFNIFKSKTQNSCSLMRSSEDFVNETTDKTILDLQKLKINGQKNHYTERALSSSNDKISLSTTLPGISTNNAGQVGLSNLGNTCFMNCILQCLSHTTCLLSFCLTENYKADINKYGKMHGYLFISFADLMKKLWCSSSQSVSPVEFKQQIQKYSPRFSGYLQQDAQEFLRFVLEGLHEDVNRIRTKIAPEIPDYEKEDKLSDCVKSKLYIDRYLRRDDSIIVDIFMGQLMSTLECLECNYKSTTFDPFYDISLPIEKRDSVTIIDCIRLFTAKEKLGNDEQPICGRCKVRRACQKSFTIQKFPRVLVLHLKRFSGERLRSKLNTFVDFPLNELDLSEFASAKCTNRETGIYKLYGIANHSGSVYGGHYTAYCFNPIAKSWFQFNDSKVSTINEASVASPEAYVLFYQSQKA